MNLKIKRMYLQLFSILCFFVFVIMAGIRISSAENIESVQNGVNIFTDYNLQNSDTENFRNFYITEDQRGYSSYKYKADKTDVNFDSGWLVRSGKNRRNDYVNGFEQRRIQHNSATRYDAII